jgi:predicted RNA-binding protein YlqC (UPF0109 family)
MVAQGKVRRMTEQDAYKELEDMLRHMATMIVDKPEEIVIEAAIGNSFVAYEVICEDSDGGALVGKRGKHADAMRTLLMAAATARGVRVTVQFMSRDQDAIAPR